MSGYSPKHKQTEQMSRRMQQLESDLKAAQRENQNMAQDVASLRRQVAAHNSQDSKRSTLESRIQVLRDEVEAEKLRANTNAAKHDLVIAQTEAALQKWRDAEKDWNYTNRQLTENISVYEAEKSSLTSELSRAKSNLDRERAMAHKQALDIENMTATIKNITSCWENSKAEAHSKSSEVTMLSSECERLRARNGVLVSQTEELAKTKKQLEDQVTSLERHLEERNASLNGSRADASELRLQLAEMTDQLEYTKQQYELFKTETDNLTTQLSLAHSKAQELANVHNRNVQDLSSTETFLRSNISTLQEKVKELEEFRATSHTLAEQNASLHSTIRELHNSLEEMSQRNDELVRMSDSLSCKKVSLEQQLAESTSANGTLALQNDELLTQRSQADEARRHLADNIKQLTETCTALRCEVNACQEVIAQKSLELEKMTDTVSDAVSMSQQQQSQAQQEQSALECELATALKTVEVLRAEKVEMEIANRFAVQKADETATALRAEMSAVVSASEVKDRIILQLEERHQSCDAAHFAASAESAAVVAKLTATFENRIEEREKVVKLLTARVDELNSIMELSGASHEKAIAHLRDELSLKFNKERDAVVVLRQKVISEERKSAALKEELSNVTAQLKEQASDVSSLESQLQEKATIASALAQRKDEYKSKVVRLESLNITLLDENKSLAADYKAVSQDHNTMVRAANRQYRQLRDGLKDARERVVALTQTSDDSVHKHLVKHGVQDFITQLDKIVFETKPALDPSANAQRPLGESPTNSPPPQKRLRVESGQLDAIHQ
jgi:chromosome segregation ATPase